MTYINNNFSGYRVNLDVVLRPNFFFFFFFAFSEYAVDPEVDALLQFYRDSVTSLW